MDGPKVHFTLTTADQIIKSDEINGPLKIRAIPNESLLKITILI